MDTSAAGIHFDEQGYCHFCREFTERANQIVFKDEVKRDADLKRLVQKLKNAGQNKKYDCVVGVSGGVDSSWSLVKAVELGLRPLAVHMDNGWNSELAQNNIEKLVKALGVDLYTHVIDWEEYRSLMQAFFNADVVDIELLYDNAMLAVNYQLAAQFGIKSILAGTNQATEGMKMPKGWNWLKYDRTNIMSIARQFHVQRMSTFPSISTFGFIYYEFFKKIKWISFLDYFNYNKSESLSVLAAEYGFKPYPYKHYESIFTRFYQGYILPEKFGIDKRKLHLSTLIMSQQMTREEALELLRQSAYPSSDTLQEDKDYFLKKMRWSDEDLKKYLQRPRKEHFDYGNEKKIWEACAKTYKTISSLGR